MTVGHAVMPQVKLRVPAKVEHILLPEHAKLHVGRRFAPLRLERPGEQPKDPQAGVPRQPASQLGVQRCRPHRQFAGSILVTVKAPPIFSASNLIFELAG